MLEHIQAYKLARWAIQQLQQQAVPSLWQDQIDRTLVSIHSKPFANKEGLEVTCSRCMHTNPLINNIGTGDVCVNCGEWPVTGGAVPHVPPHSTIPQYNV